MTPEQLEDLRYLVSHRSWTEFFVPLLQAAREQAVNKLADPSGDRKLDAYLRAVVALTERMIQNPASILEEFDLHQQQLASQEAMEVEYALRADMGRFAPLP